MVHIAIYDEDAVHMHENGAWSAPPMAGHWNMEGKSIHFLKAFVFTNCEEVKIMLNGSVINILDTSNMENGYMETDIPNLPGELFAQGFIDGKAVCEHKLKTAAGPDRLELVIENDCANKDTDIVVVAARIVDSQGTTCPFYDKPITFLCNGAEFIATDSGDPTDHTPYKSNTIKPLNGRCVALIKKRVDKNGTVTAISDRFSECITLN